MFSSFKAPNFEVGNYPVGKSVPIGRIYVLGRSLSKMVKALAVVGIIAGESTSSSCFCLIVVLLLWFNLFVIRTVLSTPLIIDGVVCFVTAI